MRKLMGIVVGLALLAVAVQQFDLLGEGGGGAGDALRSGVHTLTGKTTADLGRETATVASRARLARAVREYTSERGALPDDLAPLVEDGFIQPEAAVDEWGRTLALESTERGVALRSAGADGQFGTHDDWTLDL